MKLKTSFFNPTLYKKNLTRFWPLWGLTAFFGALIPLSLIMMRLRGDLNIGIETKAEFARLYYSGVVVFVPIVMLGYSILCAMAVWSYLYNARSVGMMHTLPIRREGLFVTNFLSGLTMVGIPWAVTGVLCVILSLMCGAFSAGPLFLTCLCVFAEGVLYFSTATAAAFLTGNIFALPFLYFLLHFLAPLLDSLITTFSSNMIFGLSSRVYTGVVDWLSPTVYLVNHVRENSVYEQIPIPGQPNVTQGVLQSVTLENAWLIGVYMLVGLALLGVAYILYRYRHSECAGEVIAMNWGRPVFRYGIAALLALGGGQLLYIIFFNSLDIDQNTYNVFPLIVCMLIAGAIGYYGASMLLAKTLRVFKGSGRGMALVAAGCVVVCCTVGFDLFGVAKRVPSVNSLRYVRLYTANNTYYLFPGEDDGVIEQLRGVHKEIIAEKDYVLESMKNSNPYRGNLNFSNTTNVTFRVSYYLKGGLSVERNYFLWVTKERMQEPGTYDNLLDAFVNSTEMKLRRLRFNDPRFNVRGGHVGVQKRDKDYDLNSREQEEVVKAIAADAQAGTWGQYDWFHEDDATYAVYLDFWYAFDNPAGLDIGMDNINVYLRPGMTNTIECLKKMGYLKDDDLITRTEMQKIWEARWAMDKEPELSGVYYEGIPWDESDVPATDGVNANPNSAPQTPVESSIASSKSVVSSVEDELQAEGTSIEETLTKQRDEYREQANNAETEEERKKLMELADSMEVMLQDYRNYSAMDGEKSGASENSETSGAESAVSGDTASASAGS